MRKKVAKRLRREAMMVCQDQGINIFYNQEKYKEIYKQKKKAWQALSMPEKTRLASI